MKATIVSPAQEQGVTLSICVVIPFKTVELSIAMDNGVGKNLSRWCSREDIRVFHKENSTDLTITVLGGNNIHAFDGMELMEIMQKVADYEKLLEN